MSEDIDAIIEAQKAAKPVTDFFSGKTVEDRVEAELAPLADDLPSPLDFKDLSPELCAEIHEAMEKADLWTERLKSLKDQAKRLAGQSRGPMQIGGYVLDIKESAGRKTTDWKAYVTATMTKKAVEEAQADPVFTKVGEPVISLSVKKLNG